MITASSQHTLDSKIYISLHKGLILFNKIGETSDLTGWCSIGNSGKAAFLTYTILPNLSQIVLGLAFLTTSYVKLACARSSRIQKKLDLYKTVSFTQTRIDRTDLSRTGVSALILSLSFVVVLTCQLLEYFNMKLTTEKISVNVRINTTNVTVGANYQQENSEGFFISLTKIFMSFLNGFLLFGMFISTKCFKNSVQNKPDIYANMDTGSDNKEILANDETTSNSVQSVAYHNDEIYERSCQLAALPSERELHARRLRPMSDHIYCQPSYFYDTGILKLDGMLAEAESVESFNIAFPRMNTFNSKKQYDYNECTVEV